VDWFLEKLFSLDIFFQDRNVRKGQIIFWTSGIIFRKKFVKQPQQQNLQTWSFTWKKNGKDVPPEQGLQGRHFQADILNAGFKIFKQLTDSLDLISNDYLDWWYLLVTGMKVNGWLETKICTFFQGASLYGMRYWPFKSMGELITSKNSAKFNWIYQ
jgi:hypothetical protein